MDRTVVRADRLDLGSVSAETVPADSLSAVSGRIVEILHEYHATDGSGGSDDLLRAGAYVLRRPAELADSVSEELDDAAVTMDPGGNWAYHVSLATERITERVVETFAVAVAGDQQTFRDVVPPPASTRKSTTRAWTTRSGVRSGTSSSSARRARRRRSPPFERLPERLGLGDVGVGRNGRLLWYDERLYRYGLYVSPAN